MNNISDQYIKEMLSFAKKRHAEIVWRKCIKAKKYKLACKIALHYGLNISQHTNDDMVISLAFALQTGGEE